MNSNAASTPPSLIRMFSVSYGIAGIHPSRLRHGADAVRLVVVSDDNFSPLQRTLLLDLRWRP